MKIFTILSYVFLLLTSACNPHQPVQNASVEKQDSVEKHKVKTTNNTLTDTLVVEKTAAVIHIADSLSIEKMKKGMDEDDFYTAADDANYYLATAYDYLKKKKIRTIDCRQKFIKFILPHKRVTLVRTDTLGLWSIYFYKPGKEPYPADLTSIEEEVKKYF